MTIPSFGEGGGPLATLMLDKDELGLAIASIAASILQVRENLKLVQSTALTIALQQRLVVAESLRTAFVEARWGIMTPEEIQQEQDDLAEARAAGIIVGD